MVPLSDGPSTNLVIMQLIAFVSLFPFSILFSSAETAFVSLTENELKDLNFSNDKKDQKLFKLISEYSDKLLITLLLGNTLVNVTISTLAALITHESLKGTALESWGMPIEVLAVGTMILLIGEIIPKTLAIKNRLNYSKRVVDPIYFFYGLFYPVTTVIEVIVKMFTSKIKDYEGLSELSRHDIKNLMEVGGEEGVLEEDEKNMITSIVEFGERDAKEIMVPRVDMKTIGDDIELDDLMAFIRETGFSRIPVYQENIDNIIGILYIKDLLNFIHKKDKEINIRKMVRDVSFIPETKSIDDLLKMFQREKIHIAIVVDEYGGTAGMITLEDIIEEIVGEIQDEFDVEEKLYRKIDNNSYEFDAKIPIDDIGDIIDLEIPDDEDYESLGGFLYFIFEEVPEIGDSRIYERYKFTILSTDKRRIGWVKVEREK